MTMPRKGSRKIVIDGNEFIWKIKKDPSHSESHDVMYQIPIQHIGGGQILLVSTGFCRSYAYKGSRVFQITPSIITRCIEYAIGEGWQFMEKLPPLEKNYPFVLLDEAKSLVKKFINVTFLNSKENIICSKIQNDIRSLLNAGEFEVALEILVTNICEYKIELSESTIDLAVRAFMIYRNYKYLLILNSIKMK